MSDRLIVERPAQGSLVIRHSAVAHVWPLAFDVLFWVTWYGILLRGTDVFSALREDWTLVLFFVAPLVSLPPFVKQVQALLTGRVYRIDRDGGNVMLNDREVAQLTDVTAVQIRTIHDSEGADTYRLSLVRIDEDKVPIAESADREELERVAEDIADLLHLGIFRK